MAVRIDNLLTTKPAAKPANQPASKTDASSPDAPQSTDFSAVLAKAAQPKKKPDDVPQNPQDTSLKPKNQTPQTSSDQAPAPPTSDQTAAQGDLPEIVPNPKPANKLKAKDLQPDDLLQDVPPADDPSASPLLQMQDDATVEDNSSVLTTLDGEIQDSDASSDESSDDPTPSAKATQSPVAPDLTQAQIASAVVTPPPATPLPQSVSPVTDETPIDTSKPILRNKPANAPSPRPAQDAASQLPMPPVPSGRPRDFVADNNPALPQTPTPLSPQAKSNDPTPTAVQQQAASVQVEVSDPPTDVSDQLMDLPDDPISPAPQPQTVARPVTNLIPSDTQDNQPPIELQAQTPQKNAQTASQSQPESVSRFSELFHDLTDDSIDNSSRGVEKVVEKTLSPTDLAITAAGSDPTAPKAVETSHAQPLPAPVPPEVRFAEDNHPQVVTAVKTQLLPSGGSIQLRLDPPDLGPLRLEVRMEDGSMSASFVTTNEQATTLLTHTLGQLKHALEGAGINVDKLQVQQGSRDQFSDTPDQRQQQSAMQDQSSSRQEQQRREMLNRMWQKVAGGDPLDLVA